MRRVLAFLTIWCLGDVALADPGSIRLQPTPEGVRADYRLAVPTSRFVFDAPLSAEVRISAIEDGVVFAADAVTSDRPMTAFSLLVRPDRVRVDATYPVVSRLGEGWMIHVPSLLGETGPLPSEVVIDPGPGWTLTAGPGGKPTDGFVYVGPAEPNPSGGARTVVDGAIPEWLANDARGAIESSNAFFARGLAIAAPGEPVLLMGALPVEDRSTYVGDVTPNGVINLQFATRMLPPERDQRFTDLVVPFVAHETFHVWQGDRFRDVEGVNGRWLTEGAAEYFGLLAQAEQSPAAAVRSREVLARRLGGCLSAMDTRPQGLIRLAGRDAQSTRYDCGTVSQWLADLQMKADGGLFAAWRRLLTPPEGYGVSDFRAILAGYPSRGDAGQTSLLDGSDDIRAAVIGSLKSLGAEVSIADPGPAAWANAALWPLLSSNCSGQRGIRTENGRFFLDTGDRCGLLSGDLEAVSIDGARLDSAGESAFSAVEMACGAQGTVSVGLMDGGDAREIRVSCSRDAPPPATAYAIARFP